MYQVFFFKLLRSRAGNVIDINYIFPVCRISCCRANEHTVQHFKNSLQWNEIERGSLQIGLLLLCSCFYLGIARRGIGDILKSRGGGLGISSVEQYRPKTNSLEPLNASCLCFSELNSGKLRQQNHDLPSPVFLYLLRNFILTSYSDVCFYF